MRWLKLILLTPIAIAVADTVLKSYELLYTPDEMINIEAAITFFSNGDYSIVKWGSIPFDPAISSGILATWVHGVVFHLGGSLFAARLASGLLQLAATMGLAVVFLRSRGIDRFASTVVALGIWLTLLLIPDHALRIMRPAELSGFLLLAGGMFFVRTRPFVASGFFGTSVWLCKAIYLPLAFILLVVQVLSGASETKETSAQHGRLALFFLYFVVFLLPLAFWLALIAARHGPITAARWLPSYISFLISHATGLDFHLPGLEGWRFAPGWDPVPSLLFSPGDVTLPYILPLVFGPLVLLLHAAAHLSGRLRVSRRQTLFLGAVGIGLVLFSIWFFLLDPTQWGHHLFPAIYASIGLAFYCLVDMWAQLGPTLSRRGVRIVAGVGLGIYAVISYGAAVRTHETFDFVRWRASYAKACHGTRVGRPPCTQDDAKNLIVEECGEDEDCMTRERNRIIQRGLSPLDGGHEAEQALTAAYVINFLQYWAYAEEGEFLADFVPVLCMENDPAFRRYFEDAGIDVGALLRKCSTRPTG